MRVPHNGATTLQSNQMLIIIADIHIFCVTFRKTAQPRNAFSAKVVANKGIAR